MRKIISIIVFAFSCSVAWAAPQGLPHQNTAIIAGNSAAIDSNSAAIDSNSAAIDSNSAAIDSNSAAIDSNSAAIANIQATAGTGKSVYDSNGVQVGQFYQYSNQTYAADPLFFTSNGYLVQGEARHTLSIYYLDTSCSVPVAYTYTADGASSGSVFLHKYGGWFMVLANITPQRLAFDVQSNSRAQYGKSGGYTCYAKSGNLSAGHGSYSTNQLIVPNNPAVSGFDPVASPGPYTVR